jgi:hypothetical protein
MGGIASRAENMTLLQDKLKNGEIPVVVHDPLSAAYESNLGFSRNEEWHSNWSARNPGSPNFDVVWEETKQAANTIGEGAKEIWDTAIAIPNKIAETIEFMKYIPYAAIGVIIYAISESKNIGSAVGTVAKSVR